MKKISALLFTLLCATITYSQCNDYYVMDQGTEWTYENFGKNGKTSGKNQQKVTAYEKTGNGFKATVNSVMFNDKGKKLMEGDLEMTCDGGVLIMDMRKFIPEEQQKAFSSYEMKMEAENLELPSKLSAGQTLKNGSITMTATGSPIPMTMSVQITDRKVLGKESITTPAGSFDCYKISSKSTIQSKMGINMTFDFSTTEWIAEKVGMVKSESFDKNGKSNGYTVLVSRK
ncbi:MAG: hypothetical protein KF725_03150 [Cyclobacteriaceae bacterium]|nr:hypothetical protein [Cyclobacteriaceae bacterium]UYN86570.1 MAG: hypothetical protein KIT51_17185 [Cyclobacteriaceae bacterium]